MPEIKRKGIISAIFTGDDDRLSIYQDTNNPAQHHIYAAKKLGLPDRGEVEIIIRWSEKPIIDGGKHAKQK